MSLLRKIGGSALRGSGRLLAVHVVPDTLIPSWKTQKRVASLGRALKPKQKKKKKPSAKSGYKSPALAGVKSARSGKPSASKNRAPFNKNAWSQGRGMSVPASFSPSRSTSRPAAGSGRRSFASVLGSQFRPSTVARRKAKLRDLKNEPVLVLQMHADELFHNVRTIKMPWKSKNPY